MFFSAVLAARTPAATKPAASTERITFTPELAEFRVEQVPGGTVSVRDGALIIEDQLGCTVWLARMLRAPVKITYDVTVVASGGPHDRVADVNCFWMASERDGAAPRARSGRFYDYDHLRLYYVGMGGNENMTTRFRRYDGSGAKPILPGHERRDPAALLQPNRTYHVQLLVHDGIAEYWRDGECLFAYTDPAPLTRGWFGFRTLKSHLEIRNLQVTAAK